MAEPLQPALKAVSDAVLAVASKRSVEQVLQQLVHSARELVDARYAALGVPDGSGGFRSFIVSGMSDELIAALGPLPRTHGMLGATLESAEPFRTNDIHTDPRFRGWWPARHPDMRSFLGVPIVSADGVVELQREPVSFREDRQLPASLVEARVGDRDRGVCREQLDQRLVTIIKA